MALIDELLKGIISDEQRAVLNIIVDVSNKFGVDPVLSVSVAILESGLNPRAIGDNHTSFGLYQLHTGGELANLTPEEAFDPRRNTETALKYFVRAQINKENKSMNPGEIAAKAQRPKYPGLYALSVNTLYPLVKMLLEHRSS